MANTSVTFDAAYAIKDLSATLSIAVTIGDGQPGSYSVFVNDAFKGSNAQTEIGNGAAVSGQKTMVIAVVTDTLTETKWTSVTATLYENGAAAATFGPYTQEVANLLDNVIYTLNITTS